MKILVVTHNLPYPPNKGEKQRMFYLIRELAQLGEIYLYSVLRGESSAVDRQALEQICHTVRIFPLTAPKGICRALLGLVSGRAISQAVFFDRELANEIETEEARQPFDFALSFCSSTAQYLRYVTTERKLVDLIDVDSAKWGELGKRGNWVRRLIFRREATLVRELEQEICAATEIRFVTSIREKERLDTIAPQYSRSNLVLPLGVDLDFFSSAEFAKRDGVGLANLVFTGQMDYEPNVNAVCYFYREILPLIRQQRPDAHFRIVGRSPTSVVRKICQQAEITGEVDDIRKYLQDAAVFVCPIRDSFGVQTKVLEAMAAGVPVVMTREVSQGLQVEHEKHCLVSADAGEFANNVLRLLSDQSLYRSLQLAGRQYVEQLHSWNTVLVQWRAEIAKL